MSDFPLLITPGTACLRKVPYETLEAALWVASPGDCVYLCPFCALLHVTTKRGLEGPQVVAAKLLHLPKGPRGLIDKYTRLIIERLNAGGDVEALRTTLGSLLSEHHALITAQQRGPA